MTSPRSLAVALTVGAALLCGPAPGSARSADDDIAVDLALVMAVDVSLSIDEKEAAIQRNGYVHALKDKRVTEAIRSGPIGKIAITYVEWSSVYHQVQVVPWHVISDAKSAAAFADEISKAPVKPGSTTSISAGLDFSVKLFDKNGYDPSRRVIDISGDGYSDYGRPVKDARDDAVKKGVTINGLAMMFERPKWKQEVPEDLDRYYNEQVIGGPGAFFVTVRTPNDFSQSLLHKLVLEIAAAPHLSGRDMSLPAE
ncbi:MAG: DUF1194 domain-containing protein [Rhodospirillaceae bacterium]